jgi:hypothetical protein
VVHGIAADYFKHAADLVALAPDVIPAAGSSSLGALQQVTRTVPIVFVHAADPVGGASSKVWRGRVAMPPVLPCSNTASAENGWSCSSRSRLV